MSKAKFSTMYSNLNIDLMDEGRSAIYILNECKKTYQHLLHICGKFFGAAFALPNVVRGNISLWSLTKAMNKKFYSALAEDITIKNYDKIKEVQSSLVNLIARLQPINDIPVHKVARIHRLLFKQFVKIFAMAVNAKEELDIKTRKLNHNHPKLEIFENIKENKLWKDKTKVYEYLA